MAGVSITIDAAALDRAIARVGALGEFDAGDLMSSIGALGESQTRRRISDEKTSPDGAAWPPNRRGGSILVETGQHLLQSVAWTSSSAEAEWGAAWEHAHVHQFGATIVPKNAERLAVPLPGGGVARPTKVVIPERPFVGLSGENRAELLELVTDFLGGLFQ
ncbi:phage virion morphogenesis protein [Methylopila sp. M107]|uniref:phage virion morphogenesis protein n=1 Tax=Methylopila sp. M107 TaxID=1101190 RepID=UPI000364C592|nr:phage virion morphogenesis protein [Methylopila sp. M107]